jgi:hypothetical protein
VKAYLVTTGTVFSLVAITLWVRVIAHWQASSGDRICCLGVAALGALAAAFAVWAWWLFSLSRVKDAA